MNTNALAVQQDSVVANLQRASTALAEAKTIQQTKKIIDVAAAAEIYAKRQQLGEENIAIAHSIKLDALRKLGEMLKAAPKNEGQIRRGTKMEPRENQPQTLAELGLDKKTSSIAQKLADLPDEAFEQVREGNETIAKAIAAVKEAKTTPAAKPAPVPEAVSELPKKEAEQEAETEANELRAHIEELTTTAKELLEENASMGAVMDADDKLAALTAENKKLRELNRVLTERIQGLQGECNEAKRAAKMWRAKFDKLGKLAA